MGNCSYLMSKPCNVTTLPYFEVHADNEYRHNTATISYVKAVHVYVHMVKISILKGGTVQVRRTTAKWNCSTYSTPSLTAFHQPQPHYELIITNGFRTFPSLTAKWDQRQPTSESSSRSFSFHVRKALHSVHEFWCNCSLWWKPLHGHQSHQRVSKANAHERTARRASSDNIVTCKCFIICSYQSMLCGLCGDYDGDAKDDFRKPDGNLTSNPNEFGHSWNTDPEWVMHWYKLTLKEQNDLQPASRDTKSSVKAKLYSSINPWSDLWLEDQINMSGIFMGISFLAHIDIGDCRQINNWCYSSSTWSSYRCS